MAQTIDPERLKQLRDLRGLTKEGLAQRAQLNKQTVYRLEKGRSPVRKGNLDRLAQVLGVDPEVLTGEKPIPSEVSQASAPADEAAAYQLNVRVDAAIRNAFELVARRYRVSVPKIAQLAPLLFVIVAEASLKHRQKKLDEFEAALGRVDELEYDFGPSFGTDDQDEKIRAEQASINHRDLFGRDRFDPFGVVYHEDKLNPFDAYLKAYLKTLTARSDEGGGEQVAARGTVRQGQPRWSLSGDDVTVEILCSTSTEYQVWRSEAVALVGGDKPIAESILRGEVPIHRMPRDLQTVEDRVEWMYQNKISVHKVPEPPGEVAADLDLPLDLEF